MTKLLSDCGGSIKKIAFTVFPDWLEHDRYNDLYGYENLLLALENDTKLEIISSASSTQEVMNWIDSIGIENPVHVNDSISTSQLNNLKYGGGIYLQDKFMTVDPTYQPAYIVCEGVAHLDQAIHLSKTTKVPLFYNLVNLVGGDTQVGDGGKWLVGWHSIQREINFLRQHTSLEEIFDRFRGFDIGRELIDVGYNSCDISSKFKGFIAEETEGLQTKDKSDHIESDGAIDLSPKRLNQQDQVKQLTPQEHLKSPFSFHLDNYLTYTGAKDVDGKDILMIADTADINNRAAQTEELNLVAERLKKKFGFAIMRNPVPFGEYFSEYLESIGLAPPQEPHLVSYNNVLLQNHPDPIVWLPVYGEQDNRLEDYDRRNAEIWQTLNFDVRPIRGWARHAKGQGSMRCCIKVLERGI